MDDEVHLDGVEVDARYHQQVVGTGQVLGKLGRISAGLEEAADPFVRVTGGHAVEHEGDSAVRVVTGLAAKVLAAFSATLRIGRLDGVMSGAQVPAVGAGCLLHHSPHSGWSKSVP